MLTTKHLALWLMAQVHITAAKQVSQVGVANIECLDKVANIECLDRVKSIAFIASIEFIVCIVFVEF